MIYEKDIHITGPLEVAGLSECLLRIIRYDRVWNDCSFICEVGACALFVCVLFGQMLTSMQRVLGQIMAEILARIVPIPTKK